MKQSLWNIRLLTLRNYQPNKLMNSKVVKFDSMQKFNQSINLPQLYKPSKETSSYEKPVLKIKCYAKN